MNVRKPKNILQTTVGFVALLTILKDLLAVTLEADNINVQFYEELISRANHIDLDDNSRYPYSTKGRKILYLDLSMAIWTEIENDDRSNQLNTLLKD